LAKNIGVFLENQCHDEFFAVAVIIIFELEKKNAILTP
jgi:hypothetical protein